jgi:hypothetical protein
MKRIQDPRRRQTDHARLHPLPLPFQQHPPLPTHAGQNKTPRRTHPHPSVGYHRHIDAQTRQPMHPQPTTG